MNEEKIDSITAIVDDFDMKTYFRSPSLVWWILIPFGLVVTFIAWLNPILLDTHYLPVIGPFASYIGQEMPDFVKFTVLIASLLHVAEAMYAALLCLNYKLSKWCTVLWTIQTFILGFPSLLLLQNGISKFEQ